MGIRERKVEKYLDACVICVGGITRKWTGNPGVPDRIVFADGKAYLVEVKTLDGTLSQVQIREHLRLEDQGFKPYTVYGKAGVDQFMKEVFEC